jgi:sulfopropanediol 3-dehydrogenase
MVIADDSADAALVACDLLGQAEHDPNSGVALICFSHDFARRCEGELNRQLEVLPTRDVAALSWRDNGRIYIAGSREEAVALADDYAPEHLEIQTADQDYYLHNLSNYGSLFVGAETTVAYGDKCIGTNHILPTSRAARYTGGLWVGKFLKTVTYQKMTPAASKVIGEVTERQCEAERMLAHAITARVRVERYSSSSWEPPRLCRGASRSLTAPGVGFLRHAERWEEPPHPHDLQHVGSPPPCGPPSPQGRGK